MSFIPDDEKEGALREFLVEFNKEAKYPLVLSAREGIASNSEHFFLAHEEIVRSRCEHMKKEATQELIEILESERGSYRTMHHAFRQAAPSPRLASEDVSSADSVASLPPDSPVSSTDGSEIDEVGLPLPVRFGKRL